MTLAYDFGLRLARELVEGYVPDESTYKTLAEVPEEEVYKLFSGTDYLREYFWGRDIHLCAIYNAKSGRCSEDCSFCAQSAHYPTEILAYPLQDPQDLQSAGIVAARQSINRYSVVTSGRGLKKEEVEAIASSMAGLRSESISTCVSLGILEENSLDILRNAGVSRYHHNLEAPESHFPNICSTHSYEDRVKTIKKAKQAGFSICAGGVFGTGESDEQVLEMSLALKGLQVDAVPVNFLTQVKGTPLQNYAQLTPLRCLKIIALLRYVLPDKEIIICGGRKDNLKRLQSMIFYAGASGIMTGDYLTTKGNSLEEDLELLAQLGLSVRKKEN